MNEEIGHATRSLSSRWIRATVLGWLIGFALVVVLAIIWDMIGGGAQFMVGVGMGSGVGYMQARVARAWTGRLGPWLWRSGIGMGSPFLLWDIASATGTKGVFSFPVCVLLGGLLTGVLQQRLLRAEFERTVLWIPACVVGWGLPAGIIEVSNSELLPQAFRVLSPIVIFLGGLLLGAVTGKTLEWMSPDERSTQRTQPTRSVGA